MNTKRYPISRLILLFMTLISSPTSAADTDNSSFFFLGDLWRWFWCTFFGMCPVCPIFPSNNIWNTRIDQAPVHAKSDAYIASIGSTTKLHPDFSALSIYGIPFVEVDRSQPDIPIEFVAYGAESDPGPYPLPLEAPIEGGPTGTGDRHAIAVDKQDCYLYELFNAFPQNDNTWHADSGAVFDLQSNDLRPDGWTSADAAGLPIYAGLVRYDEVARGEITHALRFTASRTQSSYVWPARHKASSITDENVPPMGQRFRLKSSYDISGFAEPVQVILRALKQYGLILADNGSNWFIQGAPDPRFDDDVMREIKQVPGSAFEAVDVSGWMVDPDSGEAQPN